MIFLTLSPSCTEDKYEEKPFCSSGYDKWIITKIKDKGIKK